jgi:hypothetical protein
MAAILLIIALIFFVLAAFKVPSVRFEFAALGLVFLTLSMLFGMALPYFTHAR